MAPDRFDDVDIRFMDEPEPPRRPPSLRRRMAVALSAWILAAGVLAAGASALTSSDDSAAGAAKAGSKLSRNADGVLFKRDGRKCDREHRMRSGSASSYAPSDF